MTASAPRLRAASALAGAGSDTNTEVAPAARAVCMQNSPMGPAPITSTRSPSFICDSRTACTVTAHGSASAASSSDTPSGIGIGSQSSSSTYSAYAFVFDPSGKPIVR